MRLIQGNQMVSCAAGARRPRSGGGGPGLHTEERQARRHAPPVLLLGQRGERRLGRVDEEGCVGQGGARGDRGHHRHARAVLLLQHEAVGHAAVGLQRALLGGQHGHRERHALRHTRGVCWALELATCGCSELDTQSLCSLQKAAD